jgi:hypothetical protein
LKRLEDGARLVAIAAFTSQRVDFDRGDCFVVKADTGGSIQVAPSWTRAHGYEVPRMILEKLGAVLRLEDKPGGPPPLELELAQATARKRRGRYAGRAVGKREAVQLAIKYAIENLGRVHLAEIFAGEDCERNAQVFSDAIGETQRRLGRMLRDGGGE